jgi:hypothetical protein
MEKRTSNLNPFAVFSNRIKPVLSVEARPSPLVRKIYALAQEKQYQEEQKAVAKEDATKLRPAIALYDRALRSTRKAEIQLYAAREILGANSYSQPLLALEEAIRCLDDLKGLLDTRKRLRARRASLANVRSS